MRTTSVAAIVSFFPEVPFHMFKVYSRQLRGTSITAFERHFTTENSADMDQHRCRACTKTFVLLLWASLSLKQT